MHWFFSYSHHADDASVRTREALLHALQNRANPSFSWNVSELPAPDPNHSIFVDRVMRHGTSFPQQLIQQLDMSEGGLIFLTADTKRETPDPSWSADERQSFENNSELHHLKDRRWLFIEMFSLIHKLRLRRLRGCTPILVGISLEDHAVAHAAIGVFGEELLRPTKISPGTDNDVLFQRVIDELERNLLKKPELVEATATSSDAESIIRSILQHISLETKERVIRFWLHPDRLPEMNEAEFEREIDCYVNKFGGVSMSLQMKLDRAVANVVIDGPQRFRSDNCGYMYVYANVINLICRNAADLNDLDDTILRQKDINSQLSFRWIRLDEKHKIWKSLENSICHFYYYL